VGVVLLLQEVLLVLGNVPWLRVGLERVEEEGGGRWKKLLWLKDGREGEACVWFMIQESGKRE